MPLVNGTGINTHSETIPSHSTLFPRVSWMRSDDVPVGQWTTSSLRTMANRHATYRAPGWKIAQDIGWDWGNAGGIVGHARDLLSTGLVDCLLMPNEPDRTDAGHYVDPAVYAGWCRSVQDLAARLVPGCLICGPQVSAWSLNPSSAERVWWDAWVAAGGLAAVDVVAMHLYTTTSSPAPLITSWVSDLRSRIGGKPLICTEWGMATQWVVAVKGSWTPAGAAACYSEALGAAQALGLPFLLYDGVLSLNNDGFSPLVSTTVATGAANSTQSLTSVTNVVPGMNLYFASANVIASVISVNTGSKQVLLGSSFSTTSGETVTNQDRNSDLSNWNAGWIGTPGLTAMGTVLGGLAAGI
jgi:hypothetical protein